MMFVLFVVIEEPVRGLKIAKWNGESISNEGSYTWGEGERARGEREHEVRETIELYCELVGTDGT